MTNIGVVNQTLATYTSLGGEIEVLQGVVNA